ncbi:hypothetical protein CSE16_11750 [Solibacillus sp. R5-41]|uniref:hypothetical protein n=1 Tax=Solibacillus sp. R5-41 TaxID=2048654 RepID=UPI000C1268F0|nr:hypothetical protein [Solibacillus sp. R5-41]ATP40667.1 hypothetical protein CSE16_11750 [Solibacillus sp. R5-41]
MITEELRQLVHQFILIDMAQRSVKVDKEYIEKYADNFKTAKLQLNLINKLLDELHQDYHNHKRLLTLNKIHVGKWKRANDTHTNYHFMLNGIEGSLMYNNVQLKREVENMLTSVFFSDSSMGTSQT